VDKLMWKDMDGKQPHHNLWRAVLSAIVG